MTSGPKNIPASIQGRLTNEGKKKGQPFGEVLQYYGIERFLYRLLRTPHADSFILKGGLVFYGLDVPLRRPTRDIDFLSKLENRKDIIEQVIKAALAVPFPEDGMRFDADSIAVTESQVGADRKGIHATFRGNLGNVEIPIQIDIGFSDELTAEPQVINYPTLLHDWGDLQIKGYPPETIVAEKFHIMERFAGRPSRWRDYYDIWLVQSCFDLDDQKLREALVKTFNKRGMTLPSDRPTSLSHDFAKAHQEDWQRFLRELELPGTEAISDFSKFVDVLWSFLEWPLFGLGRAKPDGRRLTWKSSRAKWE